MPIANNTSVVSTMLAALGDVEREVERRQYWRTLSDPETKPEIVLALMREVMLEIWSYQKEIDKAVFTAVGRHGHNIEEQGLIRSMIAVQIEETGHGSLALGDFITLGGDEAFARSRRPSPAAQALIGTVRHLCQYEHPLCHLGFMYFFEKFTTIMTDKVYPTLHRAGYPEDRLRFMKLHAEEDVRHADMLSNVISECEARYAYASEHIKYGFDTFRVIYPHAVWEEAFARAIGNQ